MKQSYASVALATYILEYQINACISVPSPRCFSAFQTTPPRKSTSFHALALLNDCASEAHSGFPLLQQGSAPGHHCQQQDFIGAHLCRKGEFRGKGLAQGPASLYCGHEGEVKRHYHGCVRGMCGFQECREEKLNYLFFGELQYLMTMAQPHSQ